MQEVALFAAILAKDGYTSVAPHSIPLQTTPETGPAYYVTTHTPNKHLHHKHPQFDQHNYQQQQALKHKDQLLQHLHPQTIIKPHHQTDPETQQTTRTYPETNDVTSTYYN